MAPEFPITKNFIFMDSKIIEQYGEEILCYRLRTARQKRRMQYEGLDKQLIQLHKEESCLGEQQKNLGWEPLVPPVQKGWVRSFVLREDVAKSKYADFFEEILKKINTCQYDWRKDFKRKKRKRGRKIYVVKQQAILQPYEWHFVKLNFTEAEKSFFFPVYEMNQKRQLVKRYVFKEPWRFVLKIKPNIIDKVRKKDTVIESRLSEIEDYLKKNDLRKRQGKILRGFVQYRAWVEFEKYDEVFKYKNKSLIQILDIIKNETSPEGASYLNDGYRPSKQEYIARKNKQHGTAMEDP